MAVRRKQDQARWSVVEAKKHLEAVIEEAEAHGPQPVTRNDDDEAVVVPIEGWDTHPALQGTLAEFFHRSGPGDVDPPAPNDRDDPPERRGTLVEFLDDSPLKGLDIDFERHPDTKERDVDLW